uniref:Actin n=1 Tax=uncultured SAR11 cluster alpha proteobacterium H17925_45G17 TaxID=715038 RepID=E7CA46_9PROT|nr:Actin [uncultured SAR11 cluster alpha proteobacterium H17925_45G17]
MEAALNMDVARLSGMFTETDSNVIADIELMLPDGEIIITDVPADADGRDLLEHLHGVANFRGHVLFGGQRVNEDDLVSDLGLQVGGRLQVSANRDDEVVVMDNGSDTIKAGFGGDDTPCVIEQSVVGYDKQWRGRPQEGTPSFVGTEAFERHSTNLLKRPIEHGMVTDWENMEVLWRHVFENSLGVSSCSGALMTEPPLNPKDNRERMTQMMFESFHLPQFYLALTPVLALYASGRTSGLSLDSGYAVTHCVPIYEGYSLPHAIQRNDRNSGRDLTDFLSQLLPESGIRLSTSAERLIVRDMKEKLCRVSLDFDHEVNTAMSQEYTMPDSTVVTVNNQMIRVPEVMFKPYLDGSSRRHFSIHEILKRTIFDNDIDLHRVLMENIVLSGGNTKFVNYGERMEAEVKQLVPNPMMSSWVHTVVPRENDSLFSAWTGGALLSALSTFEGMWLTMEMYNEKGPRAIHEVCFS